MDFRIYKSNQAANQKYWWVAVANNHQKLCVSEMLSSKQACLSAIALLREGAAKGGVFDETGESR